MFYNGVYKAIFLKRAVAGRIHLQCRKDTELAGKLPENELTDTVECCVFETSLQTQLFLKTCFRYAMFYT
jgi:hypothetical protein